MNGTLDKEKRREGRERGREQEDWTLTPNSTTSASMMEPITVMKSNVFQGSLKKFLGRETDERLVYSQQENTITCSTNHLKKLNSV